MELNIRDWLIILGSLVAAGFMLDVYRRVRSGYSDKLRLSAKQREEADDLANPELPGGSARVMSRSKAIPSYEKSQSETKSLSSEQEREPVPVLMDSVDEFDEPTAEEPYAQDSSMDDLYADELNAKDLEAHSAENQKTEKPKAERIVIDDDSVLSAQESLGELAFAPGDSPSATQTPSAENKRVATPAENVFAAKRNSGQDKPSADSNLEEIIVLHVVAADGGLISGSALLQILLACDVRFGRMSIFHRYEEPGGGGEEQFSVVNMVAPGTFDLEDMDSFSSPGVSFFMRLLGPKASIKAFDCMVETAQCLIKNLECELHDEAHSVVTTQTLQHLRQRIRDFERRQLTLV
ncbi:MAG: cell division protein ZipA [Paracoccaceae bacterium]|jgi:cell division protein ZipA